MTRPTSLTPSYCRDHSTEQAYVIIDGKRHWVGSRGSYGAQARYDRLMGKWIARGHVADVSAGTGAPATAALRGRVPRVLGTRRGRLSGSADRFDVT
jgi:hypothetical protein